MKVKYMTEMNPKIMSPLALAFIGDAVMSLKMREYVLSLGYAKPNDFQRLTVKFVSAKAQAEFMTTLTEQGFFTEEELAVFKRGRNAKSLTVPKNTDVLTYKVSTGFEALIGYLYLSEQLDRVEEIFDRIKEMREI